MLPWLEQHRAMAQQRLAQQGDTQTLSEEEAQEKFMDAVGRMAPLTDTKLGLVGSIQHLHLLPDFHDRLEQAGFDVTVPMEVLAYPSRPGSRLQLFGRRPLDWPLPLPRERRLPPHRPRASHG